MPGGRPSKLTPEVQQRLCDAIAAGNHYKAACGYAGVSQKVYCEWMNRGAKEKRGTFREFRKAVLKARADAEVALVARWQKHTAESWQACRDLLARRFPKRWAKRNVHEIGGTPKRPLKAEVRPSLSAEGLANAGRMAADAYSRLEPYQQVILAFLNGQHSGQANGAAAEGATSDAPPAEPPPSPPPSRPPPTRLRV
jgi:hypothetical protein